MLGPDGQLLSVVFHLLLQYFVVFECETASEYF